MIFVVPIALPSASNLREHWRARHRRVKAQREAVAWVLGNRPRPVLPCVVTITRVAPRSLDGDNLQGAAKGCRDEIARWLGVDDADPRVTWAYGQRKDKPPRVEIAIGSRGVLP